MRAAVKAVRQLEPSSITVAVPVAAPDSVAQLEPLADRIICLHMPHDLYAIGRWYQNFDQTPDRLVVDLLQRAWSREGSRHEPVIRDPDALHLGKARLHGDLCVPAAARGLVVFVHGSGSSRHSPRNQSVARCFNEMGLATLLFDLLTKHSNPSTRSPASCASTSPCSANA